jgi:AraC-like DNA-binding protein
VVGDDDLFGGHLGPTLLMFSKDDDEPLQRGLTMPGVTRCLASHPGAPRGTGGRLGQVLSEGKRSVSDAGLSAGFENPSHFARMFRKIVGVSPSRFRFEKH